MLTLLLSDYKIYFEGCEPVKLRVFSLVLVIFILFTTLLVGCDPVDKNYGVSESEDNGYTEILESEIMSSDRVMSKYFDITKFDEENYADIYLGKKFKIQAEFLGEEIPVPVKLSDIEKFGWTLADGNLYNNASLVFAYETVDVTFVNAEGIALKAQMYNSSRSSVKLSDCYIVKFFIDNNYYVAGEKYNDFNINGITNGMAITDVVDILGTPSHFYKVSDTCYYLDYFITKKDRRNGITIYVNPVDDVILSVEFSYYK